MATPLSDGVTLRKCAPADLPVFFAQQLDPDANYMAAFTSPTPDDEAVFMQRWERLLSDERIINRTVLLGGQVSGNIACFDLFGERAVAYWLGKEFWGKGVATAALALFLQEVTERPLTARVAKDNIGSRRVLEKCGFRVRGEDRGFAHARGGEVEEYILELR